MAENKKEGYSFISSEKQQKNALKAFGVQSIVIIVIIIAAFVVLNYFGIFPLNKIIPKFFSWLPTNSKSISQPDIPVAGRALNPNDPIITTEPTIDVSKLKHSISIVSDYPAYNITLNNSQELIKSLEEWGLYDKTYNFGKGRGTTNGQPLYKVIVHFTDKPQTLNVTMVDKQVAFASDVKASSARIDVYVYLAPFVLNGEKKYTLDKSSYFEDEMLSILFKISHQTSNAAEQRSLNVEMVNSVRKLEQNNKNIVILTKK